MVSIPSAIARMPKRVREGDDCARDRVVVVAHAGARHERAVDLERLDREALEVRERRVPGAEVVDREVHAERAQRAERVDRGSASRMTALSVISSQTVSGSIPVPCEDPSDVVGQGGLGELARARG